MQDFAYNFGSAGTPGAHLWIFLSTSSTILSAVIPIILQKWKWKVRPREDVDFLKDHSQMWSCWTQISWLRAFRTECLASSHLWSPSPLYLIFFTLIVSLFLHFSPFCFLSLVLFHSHIYIFSFQACFLLCFPSPLFVFSFSLPCASGTQSIDEP